MSQINQISVDHSLPVIDRSQLDLLLSSDWEESDVSLIGELFDTESSKKMDVLSEVCANNDCSALRQIVHFVSGSAGNLGLVRQHAFYSEIERALNAQTLTDLSDCEGVIHSEFEEAREAFRREFKL